MESRYEPEEAARCEGDPLALRVYTSRLLGAEPTLVLHGGGNTSVKVTEKDLFGAEQELLYVKGSGWDLKTIEAPGFAPVKMDTLLALSELDQLTDTDMVRTQRSAMTDPGAPNPSVEAILHAIIPFTFVDHTHADAVVAITNTPDGAQRIASIYGDRVLMIPYVMPGFKLAAAIRDAARDVDWTRLEGMILLNHGVFSFAETAKESYERMIQIVTEAERYLADQKALPTVNSTERQPDAQDIARLRKAACDAFGAPVVARLDASPAVQTFASLQDAETIGTRGTLTPDHVIRTKPKPLIVSGDPRTACERFARDYEAYFARNATDGLTQLDVAPRWALWPGYGTVALGRTVKEADIVRDIVRHTLPAIRWAEALGGWQPLGEADLFEMEYWELEQAKLKRAKGRPAMAGRVALVTGAAGGIGRAVASHLMSLGAAVIGVDIDERVLRPDEGAGYLGLIADLTQSEDVQRAVSEGVRTFGGLDMLVSNAGTFPPGVSISDMSDAFWDETLAVNLTSHQRVLKACEPYLAQGFEPAVVIIGSKNVPAPGPGVGAYSVSKAGLTQLARVAALEFGASGIRVNVVHPNAVFDTGIWDPEKIAARAQHYGVSSEEYRRNNILGVEVDSQAVAELVATMLGPAFKSTTGAQVPIDGGNERVI